MREKEGCHCQRELRVERVRLFAKKRPWSDGDLNATATSQLRLVEEDSSSRSSRQLQEQDE